MEDGKKMIPILYEDNHILVVEKPINIPVQKDNSDDEDLHRMLKKYLKEKYKKPGNVYLGLLHRLDRPVSGLMVFAKTSKAAKRISMQIQNHTFQKKYLAVLEGCAKQEDMLEDYLTKDKKKNIVKVDTKGKKAVLTYKRLAYQDGKSLVDIFLKTGRPHQIRVQFSTRNMPLYGDQRYNTKAKKGQQIALHAYFLSFYHPITKENITFTLPYPTRNPFSSFTKKNGKK